MDITDVCLAVYRYYCFVPMRIVCCRHRHEY